MWFRNLWNVIAAKFNPWSQKEAPGIVWEYNLNKNFMIRECFLLFGGDAKHPYIAMPKVFRQILGGEA